MNERTLANNKISQFILRIDLAPDSNIDFGVLAEMLKVDYGSLKTELKVNFNVNVQTIEVRREQYLTYILGEAPHVTLKLDSFEKAIIMMSVHYNDNSVYKERLAHIITCIGALCQETKAQRIGLRYINKFSCPKIADISKVLNTTDAKSVKDALGRENIARAMVVHEYQCGTHMRRVQCGIPNRFYPSVITNYDLVLDIDVYSGGIMGLESWEDSVREYNHAAYDTFVSYTKNSLIEGLR